MYNNEEMYNEEMNNEIGIDELYDAMSDNNTDIDDIDSENVNLMVINVDRSGSMSPYTNDMIKSLSDFKDSLINSKEADEILITRANFDDVVDASAGYKNISEFDTSYNTYCCTLLYDCIVESVEKMLKYRDYLMNNGVRVKCVFAVFSDGRDNGSNASFDEAKAAIDKLNREEITTAFIAFGNDASYEASTLKFRNILNVNSSASELRKAFNCLSKSVIESSKSVIADGDNFFV